MDSPSDDTGGSSSLSRRDLQDLAEIFPSLGFSLEEESEEARALRENAERQAALRALHQRREASRRYRAWKKSHKKRRLTRDPRLNKVHKKRRSRKGKFRLRRRSRARKSRKRKSRKRKSGKSTKRKKKVRKIGRVRKSRRKKSRKRSHRKSRRGRFRMEGMKVQTVERELITDIYVGDYLFSFYIGTWLGSDMIVLKFAYRNEETEGGYCKKALEAALKKYITINEKAKNAKYLWIEVGSKTAVAAYNCYTKAAKLLGFNLLPAIELDPGATTLDERTKSWLKNFKERWGDVKYPDERFAYEKAGLERLSYVEGGKRYEIEDSESGKSKRMILKNRKKDENELGASFLLIFEKHF